MSSSSSSDPAPAAGTAGETLPASASPAHAREDESAGAGADASADVDVPDAAAAPAAPDSSDASKASSPAKRVKSAPVLAYWETIRGTGNPVRLALALAKVDWQETTVPDDVYETKPDAGTERLPFGQWPTLTDGDAVVAPSEAILRYVQRKYLKSPALTQRQELALDMLLPTIATLRQAYSKLIYDAKLSPEGKDAFHKRHISRATVTGRCDGAHLVYLENALERFGANPWATGSRKPTVADAILCDTVHNLSRVFEDVRSFAKLWELHQRFYELPEIAKFVAERQPKDINEGGVGN